MSSIPMNRLGGRAFHHADNDDDDVEREYDRLRDLAREEANKRNQCFERSQQAYQSGDGAAAKELSNEGKRHAQKMEDYNRQASEYIFRENNAAGRVTGSCIDLHGQFVEEAERMLEQRIRADRDRGQEHLHAIVGKGNHSTGHVQKLKPRIEALCRELGLKYSTEENAGRIYINLQGNDATMPPPPQVGGGQQHHGGGQQQHGGGQQQHGGGQQQHGGGQQQHGGGQQQHGGGQQQHGGGQQQHGGKPHGGKPHGGQQQHHGGQQQQDQEDDIVVKILKKLEKACCVVM